MKNTGINCLLVLGLLLSFNPGIISQKEPGIKFIIVENMPIFPGCNDQISDKEKQACSKLKLEGYIQKNLVYPETAWENKIEGIVVVEFVVSATGVITTPKIVKDIGYGCGEAALEVVKSMNHMKEKWVPGKQRGENVAIEYIVPVEFNLDNNH